MPAHKAPANEPVACAIGATAMSQPAGCRKAAPQGD